MAFIVSLQKCRPLGGLNFDETIAKEETGFLQSLYDKGSISTGLMWKDDPGSRVPACGGCFIKMDER